MAAIETLVHNLVEELKSLGHLHDPAVEAAFRSMPRHLFVPDLPVEEVYKNRSIPTKHLEGQLVSSSSQPSIMAIMLEQLDVRPGQRVLEIGAGTGYNAALLANLVGESGYVFTVDIDEDIVAYAGQHLAAAGVNNAQVICADGDTGYPQGAPYDRILLTASAADILPAWREQLREGGKLVLPLAIGLMQVSAAFQKNGDRLESQSGVECGFMPLRGALSTGLVRRLQLGPDSSLHMTTLHKNAVEPTEVYQWLLDGPAATRAAGLEAGSRQIFTGLHTWLVIQSSNWCTLSATGDQVHQGVVPIVTGFSGPWLFGLTCGILGERGLAVLAYPPGQEVRLSDPNQPIPDEPFQLQINLYGQGDDLMDRVTELACAWEQAGRPAGQFLQVVAYPRGASPAPSTGEYVLENPYSTLLIRWNASNG